MNSTHDFVERGCPIFGERSNQSEIKFNVHPNVRFQRQQAGVEINSQSATSL